MEQKNKNDVANKKKKKIVVMWKIVGPPTVSVLYIYIDVGKKMSDITHIRPALKIKKN